MGGSNSNQLRLIFLFGKSILRYVLDVIRMTNTDHLRQNLDLHSQSGTKILTFDGKVLDLFFFSPLDCSRGVERFKHQDRQNRM